MNKKLFLLGVIGAILGACTFSHTTSVNEKDTFVTSVPYQLKWLSKNRELVVKRSVKYVRKRHPTTAAWFPRLKIRNVRLEVKAGLIESPPVLSEILNETSARLLPINSEAEEWTADIDVRFATPEFNKALWAVVVPYGILCWQNMLLLCPLRDTGVVILDAKITGKDGKPIGIKGYGGDAHYVSTPWIYDSEDPNVTGQGVATSKAIAAAIADLADKFVAEVEKLHAAGALKPVSGGNN